MKIAYYVVTTLLTLMMLLSAGNMLFNHSMVAEGFRALGYPEYLIYPLGVAKLLGLAAIWSNYSRTLKEWAYAGFFFNALIALSAHVQAGDGNWPMAAVFIVLLLTSHAIWKRSPAKN